jgi:cupin 2 domain-containing protein
VNLFASIPLHLSNELIETLLSAQHVCIERIISMGHTSPTGFWYDQAEHEFVVLLSGAARLRFEDAEVEMIAGSCINIPAHRKHRVEWTDPTQPTIWLAIHYGD